MLKQLKQVLRDVSVWFFRLIGSEIRDCRTGKPLGRGLIFYWGGRVHLLGCDCAVVPVPMLQHGSEGVEDVEVAHTGFRDGSELGSQLHFRFALPKMLS